MIRDTAAGRFRLSNVSQANAGRPSQGGLPLRLFAWGFAISVLATVLGIGLSWQLIHLLDETRAREVQLNEYVVQVRLFDEVLTMSARMGAATGDVAYKQRYDKYDAELDALIKRTAIALGLPEVRQFVEQTDEANQKLVEMERRAFALASEGRGKEASALLVSDQYLKWKRAYAKGVDATVAWQRAAIEGEQSHLRFLATAFEISSAVVVVILLSTWYLAIRAANRWGKERLAAEAELRRARDTLELQVDERTKELQTSNEALRDEAGALERETTERKRAEEKAREGEATFRSLAENGIAGIAIATQEGEIAYINPRFANMLGFKAATDLIGRSVFDFVVDADKSSVDNAIETLFSGQQTSIEIAIRLLVEHGDVVNVLIQASLTVFKGKRTVIGVALDISERTAAEEKIKTLNEQLARNIEVLKRHAHDTEIVSRAERDTAIVPFHGRSLSDHRHRGGQTVA